MKLLPGQVASESTKIRESAYGAVANEYYNALLHPTCADFRNASLLYLRGFFAEERPAGRIADIGCGKSLVSKFVDSNLVLVDESEEMLALNGDKFEKRIIDVTSSNFGVNEFDWIFAILADPYNLPIFWKNVELALRVRGKCVFLVPSFRWVVKFRESSALEKAGCARFDLSNGNSIFLPSYVFSEGDQIDIIEGAALRVLAVDHILKRSLSEIRSEKVIGYLCDDDAILDVYIVEKGRK